MYIYISLSSSVRVYLLNLCGRVSFVMRMWTRFMYNSLSFLFFFFLVISLLKVSRLPLHISPPLAKTSAFSFTRVFLFVNARFFFVIFFLFFSFLLLYNSFFFFSSSILIRYSFALVLCVSLRFDTIISFLFSAKCISSWVAIDEVHCVQFLFFFF